jgi:hypothetical protein
MGGDNGVRLKKVMDKKYDMLMLAGLVLTGLAAIVAYMKWSNNCER